VLLMRRPPEANDRAVASIDEAIAWLDRMMTSDFLRGV
jgi:hypothetical protein